MAAAEQAVEAVADVVETAGVDLVTAAGYVRDLTSTKIKFGVLGFGVGLAAGGAIGYVVAGKRLRTKFEALAQAEIDEMSEHFRNVELARQGRDVKRDPIEKVVEDLGYKAPPEPKPDVVVEKPVVNITNVFSEKSDEVWDYEKELASRSPHAPYIISRAEWDEVDREQDGAYETAMVTYYREDDVLADVRDQRIADHDVKVGLANLEKFGHGSEDANVLFVRNDQEKVDFEIILSPGSFTKEVLGQEVDPPDDENSLQHGSMRRRRPRESDERYSER